MFLTANLLHIPRLGSNISVLTSYDLPEPELAVISSLNDSKAPNIYDLVGSKLVIYCDNKCSVSKCNKTISNSNRQ